MAHGDAREEKWRGKRGMEWVASSLALHLNAVYPTLLPLMRTPRLPTADWTDTPADINGLVRFAGRPNLASAHVPSHSVFTLPPRCNKDFFFNSVQEFYTPNRGSWFSGRLTYMTLYTSPMICKSFSWALPELPFFDFQFRICDLQNLPITILRPESKIEICTVTLYNSRSTSPAYRTKTEDKKRLPT